MSTHWCYFLLQRDIRVIKCEVIWSPCLLLKLITVIENYAKVKVQLAREGIYKFRNIYDHIM